MKVVIVSPVVHDGDELVEGDTPDLPIPVAQALVAAGAAIASGRKAKEEAEPTKAAE